MATYYESAYKQLLMGVSQQDPKDRLDGQLTEQINMTSDPVYGLRRRGPLRYEGTIPYVWEPDKVAVLNTTLTGELLWVTVSTPGDIGIVNKAGDLVWAKNVPYLKCSSRAALRFAVINNSIYIVNVEQNPRTVQDATHAGYPNPNLLGYWAVQAASFSTKYQCTVTFLDTGATIEAEYNTPKNDGSDLAVQQTTLEYIANDFVKKFDGQYGLTAAARGNILAIKSDSRPISITTSNTRSLVKASYNARIRSVDDLPSHIDIDFMNNFIVEVGSGKVSTYYRYDSVQKIWLEDAKWGDGVTLDNMPVKLVPKSSVEWDVAQPTYVRRSAGSSSTNPTPKFVENGITGMGVFQGRLVLLAREYVCMSATNEPESWFRSTLESVNASDPIEAAGSDSAASAYVHTTLFNKDLVIYGSDIQSIIPGTQPVTPSNVAIGIMSRYKCTLYSAPASTGRSQYVGATRGDGYGAVWEMVPSDYTSSQIIANDVTRHIPAYVKGTVRIITAATTSSIVAVAFTGDLNTLLIEEYLWDGSEKKQAAWHKWTFTKPIIHAVFDQDTLFILFRDELANGTELGSIDLRRGAASASVTVPRLDFHKTFVVNSSGQVTMSLNYYQLVRDNIYGFKITGTGKINTGVALSNITIDGQVVTATAVGCSEKDEVVVGIRYKSSFTLTPPKIQDSNGVAVTMYKATLQEYHINWAYTGVMSYEFKDQFRTVGEANVTPALLRSDPAKANWIPQDVVQTRYPVRLDMNTIQSTFTSDDVFDLCPTLVEYGYRYNQVKGRRV